MDFVGWSGKEDSAAAGSSMVVVAWGLKLTRPALGDSSRPHLAIVFRLACWRLRQRCWMLQFGCRACLGDAVMLPPVWQWDVSWLAPPHC